MQFYKFSRLELNGYQSLTVNMMSNASFLWNGIKQMMVDGQPRFHILDAGDSGCLPLVTAMLNPELNLPLDSIDLQHAPAALVC